MEITVEQERKELLKEIKSISSEKIRQILMNIYKKVIKDYGLRSKD